MKHLAIELELSNERYILFLCQILRSAHDDSNVMLLEALCI
jgi:hypothetical protein